MARLSPLLPLLLILGTFLLLAQPTQALSPFSSTAMSFCKCRCNSTSTIIPLYRPQLASNPCLSCTRQFCLDQKLPQCVGVEHPEEDPDTGTGEEGDVEARCFQRDSPKSHFIVISFLVIVGTLLVFAGLKHYGFDLQAIFNRSGIKGVISEFAQVASVIVTRRRRGGPMYNSMPP
ncbi:SPOSA6832_00248 [Sporobolomyces salmonicolor]|uniref:SPOSA6832_00248-mRNA-1:cds n=1 Tax=Sporidiobolus salmonicolor TaxID=5005 RepID=A0A0D6EG97_SPOSA|nr:SPOSA6832_00248 [Sporobolomyces salmonicolor]